MPSQIEKIVLAADRTETENVLPNFCDSPLGIGLERRRCRFCFLDPPGKPLQSLTIHLPTGRERKGVEEYPCGRNHVAGQLLCQETSKILCGRGGVDPRNDTAHQSRLPKSGTRRLPQAMEKEPTLRVDQLLDSLGILDHFISPLSRRPSNPPTNSGSPQAVATIARH